MFELLPDDHSILRETAEQVNWRSPGFDLHDVVLKMMETMKAKKGIGLAAPQIGMSKRLFLLFTESKFRVCLNPTIMKYGKTRTVYEEGCLTYPGKYLKISRPTEIQVMYMDLAGKWVREVYTGITSRAFQHELDHLNGSLFCERYGPVKALVEDDGLREAN